MRERLLRLGARGPGVIVSVAVVCCVALLLPPPGFVALTLGLLVMSLVLGGRRLEPVTLRLRYRARPPREGEQALLAPAIRHLRQVGIAPPVVHILSAPGRAQEPQPIGHRGVRVSTGMIDQLSAGRLSAEAAAAAMAYAIGIRDIGHTRFQMVYEFWTLPSQMIRAITGGIGRIFTELPLVAVAWRVRGLLGAAALAQCAQQGQWDIGLLAFVLVASTYLTPWCRDQWDLRLQRSADQFVIDHGLGEARARMLHRTPRTLAVRAGSRRISGIEPTAPSPTMLVVNEHPSIGQAAHQDESAPAFRSHALAGKVPRRR